MRIWKEEVFGPVMVVVQFSNDAEAVALANDCAFGLGSNVFSASCKRANAIARQLQVVSKRQASRFHWIRACFTSFVRSITLCMLFAPGDHGACRIEDNVFAFNQALPDQIGCRMPFLLSVSPSVMLDIVATLEIPCSSQTPEGGNMSDVLTAGWNDNHQ